MVQILLHYYLVILLVHRQTLSVVGQVPVTVNPRLILYSLLPFLLIRLKRLAYTIFVELQAVLNSTDYGVSTSSLTPLFTLTRLSLLIGT